MPSNKTVTAEHIATSAAIAGAVGAVSGGLVAHQYPYIFLSPINYHFTLETSTGFVDVSTVEIGSIILGGFIGVALVYWAWGKDQGKVAKGHDTGEAPAGAGGVVEGDTGRATGADHTDEVEVDEDGDAFVAAPANEDGCGAHDDTYARLVAEEIGDHDGDEGDSLNRALI